MDELGGEDVVADGDRRRSQLEALGVERAREVRAELARVGDDGDARGLAAPELGGLLSDAGRLAHGLGRDDEELLLVDELDERVALST